MTIPFPTQFVQGVGSVSGDQFNTFTQSVTTAALLRTFIGTSTMFVLLGGISTVNDGTAGIFYWNSTSTGPDDNLNVIVPSAAASGAWLRLSSSTLLPSSIPIRVVTTTATVLSTDGVIEANATAGSFTITYPLNLSLSSTAVNPVFIVKTDTTSNIVSISDGTNTVDAIVTPATSLGQIGGWREIYSNGTNLRSMGAG